VDGNTVVDCASSVDDRGRGPELSASERSFGRPALALSGKEVRITASLLAPSRLAEGQIVPRDDGQAVIAEFIRTKGITRCPTACVVPTQGSVSAADRAALEEYAMARDRVRREKSLRARLFWTVEAQRHQDK
jgi:hypothetical protein